MESFTVLDRGASPFIYDLGDSLVEIGSGSLNVYKADTLGNIGRRINVARDTTRIRTIPIPLGDGWFEIIAKRSTSANGDYRWPYFYKFHVSDTGYVEGRFREIDLYRHDKIVAAAPIEGGDYIVAYRRGDDNSRTWATRITPEGEIVWTTEILPHENPYLWYVAGILQKSDTPGRFYIYGSKEYIPNPQDFYRVVFVTEIDTSGEIMWSRDYELTEPGAFELFGIGVYQMLSFADGTYAVIGSREGVNLPFFYISYFHIDAEGELLNRIDYHKSEDLGNVLSQVIGGDKLLILAHYDHAEDHAKRGMGLLYINEEGDSLDGHFFHPDTTDVFQPGPLLVRPDGKVMLWLFANTASLNLRRASDILYTFYPDGRPGGVEGGNRIPPTAFVLNPAYPNPFNSSTTIEYRVGANSNSPVTLSLYDLSGRLVQTLVEGRLTPGNYRTTVNANNLAAGVYIVKMENHTSLTKGGQGGSSKKLVVVK